MKNTQAFIIGLLTILIVSATANAATWTVTKAANSNDNVCDADCSLREAIFNADSGDSVVFNSNLVGQTITLGGGEIVITKRITIDGFINDPNVAFISGMDASRIFNLQAGSGLELKNAILVAGNGKSSLNAPGDSEGGAIYANNASLSLDRVALRGNSAKYSGAVQMFGGTHHFINSSFTGNRAETATAFGVLAGATLYMSNATVSNNRYLIGGDGSYGGAIVLQGGNLFVRNSTIAFNSGRLGGGIAYAAGNNSVLDIGNTIVAENTAALTGQDIYSVNGLTIISRGGNLIGNLETVPANTFNQPSDIFGVNPLLGPINANLGGFPVIHHPLQAGSPARNGGVNANAIDPLTNQPLTTDTRGAGFPRITDTTVDIGAFEDQTGNTSLIVTKNANGNDFVCDTDCSLREAVYQASLNFGTETITFAPNVFGSLVLGGTEILITNQSVNIVGYPTLNAETLIASGNNANRIFHLNNATVKISGMTLANGNAGAGFGGAVLAENNSNLMLHNTHIRNNFAEAYGAIYLSGGTANITNSTINNNSANTGLAIGASGTLNMSNTTVSSNLDADGGAGIGAIYVTGTANIRNSTIAFNRTSGGTGGGIFVSGTLNIGNSIVSNNIALTSPDIHFSSGTITSVGGNSVQNTNGFPIGTFSQTNDAAGVDPLLEALADNNGNVKTHSLMPNSPSLNTGINANAVNPFDNSILATDARGNGYYRISNNTVDKGAFEAFAPTAASVSISGRVTNGKSAITRAQVFLTDQNGETKTVLTNTFGHFRFEQIEAGQTYIVNVNAKSYQFNPQIISPTEEISDLTFVPVIQN
jgi:fibronectin-binding autotransporter adhesin